MSDCFVFSSSFSPFVIYSAPELRNNNLTFLKVPMGKLSYLLASSRGRSEVRISHRAALLDLVEIQCPAQGHFITVETCQCKACTIVNFLCMEYYAQLCVHCSVFSYCLHILLACQQQYCISPDLPQFIAHIEFSTD